MNGTRLDISYPVNRLGVYIANSSLQHYSAIKWIIRYLAGTRSLGSTYCESQDKNEETLFHGYSDAAFVNQDDDKSTSEYVFLASKGAITWKLEKQTIIALLCL